MLGVEANVQGGLKEDAKRSSCQESFPTAGSDLVNLAQGLSDQPSSM